MERERLALIANFAAMAASAAVRHRPTGESLARMVTDLGRSYGVTREEAQAVLDLPLARLEELADPWPAD